MKSLFVVALTLLWHVAVAQRSDLIDRPREKVPGIPAKDSAAETATAPPSDATALPARYTNALVLNTTTEAGRIAQLVANLLQVQHYSQHRFDDEMSERFFTRYLETLDPQRVYFLESDVEELSKYKNRLDELTLRQTNTQPAFDIFNRYLSRFDQQYAYVTDLLHREPFSFESTERFVANRKDEPRPKSIEEAERIWRDRLRYEYLTEKLNLPPADKMIATLWRESLLSSAEDPFNLTTLLRSGVKLDTNQLASVSTNLLATNALVNLLGREKAVEWVNFLAQNLTPVEGGKGGFNIRGSGTLLEAPLSTNPPPAFAALVESKLQPDRTQEIVRTLLKRYNRVLRFWKQFDWADVLQIYLNALANAYDPHSDYFGKSESDNFAIGMNLSLFGIGATLTTEDGYTVIKEIKPGSPAEKSKQLHVNDRIVGVAQADREPVDVVEEKLNRVVEMIRGPKGTEVRLTVIPHDAPDRSARKIVKITRDEIKLEEGEAKAKLIELPDASGRITRIGVIDLPSFYTPFPGISGPQRAATNSTTRDVARLVRKLKQEKVDGLILDLRRNGGGSLEESVRLTGLFIKSGPVVQVQDSNKHRGVDDDEDPTILWDGPLLVMTSRFSASASEIVAGALQDYGRALIVGDTSTHGKGTVQNLTDLTPYTRAWGVKASPGSLKVTIRKFYRASGASTQLKGVVPDLVLPSINNVLDIGESSLPNALPWDTISPETYRPVNLIAPVLPELQKRSTERVSADRDFDYVREDMERVRKQKEDKTVSLNEAERLREKEENKTRIEARKKELGARRTPQPTTYEITLKNCDLPGLPTPIGKTNSTGIAKSDKSADGKQAPASVGASSSEKAADDDDDLPESSDVPGVAIDVPLKESERILLDLIQLTGKAPPTARVP